jgi:tRNA(fMet)-specific endonuclease VapC
LADSLHGAEKSKAPAKSLAVVEDFCSRLEVLPTVPKRRNIKQVRYLWGFLL